MIKTETLLKLANEGLNDISKRLKLIEILQENLREETIKNTGNKKQIKESAFIKKYLKVNDPNRPFTQGININDDKMYIIDGFSVVRVTNSFGFNIVPDEKKFKNVENLKPNEKDYMTIDINIKDMLAQCKINKIEEKNHNLIKNIWINPYYSFIIDFMYKEDSETKILVANDYTNTVPILIKNQYRWSIILPIRVPDQEEEEDEN